MANHLNSLVVAYTLVVSAIFSERVPGASLFGISLVPVYIFITIGFAVALLPLYFDGLWNVPIAELGPLRGMRFFLVLMIGPSMMSSGAALITANRFAVGVMFLFFGGFVVGIPSALVLDPPLPPVTITVQSDTAMKEHPNPIEGRLVTHRDMFWHLFTEKNELLSIPDDQVLAVRTGT